MNLLLFMTWDVSLKLWQEKGLLARELRMYEALARDHGVQTTILSWGGAEERVIAADYPFIEVVPLYEAIPQFRYKTLRALASLWALWSARKALRKADLYKTNQMWGAWVAALARRIYRKPLILRCGFELMKFTRAEGHGALRGWFIKALSRFAYRAADHICVATQSDKDFVMNEFGCADETISLHPNWIDTDLFKPVETAQKDNHILFVGRLNAQKNLENLILALGESDYTLDIIGQGELKQSLKDIAQYADTKVNFMGIVPNDKLPALYNAYPVFILPSWYEGNPKTLLEAMSCGCAVIGTNVEGTSDIIDDGASGILCETNPQALYEGIHSLMGDAARRAGLGKAARQVIADNQTLEKLVDKERRLYYALSQRTN